MRRPDVYDDVRCGLVHEYSIKSVKGDDSVIKIEGQDCGTVYDKRTRKYTFYLRKYLEDFRIALDKYIEELDANDEECFHLNISEIC